MSRDMNKLQPEFKEKLEQAIETAREQHGIYMVPYETERDVWRQAGLWRRSRSGYLIREECKELRREGAGYLADVIESVGPQHGSWATNALPGQSWHQWGLACDLYWDKNGPLPGGVEWSDLTGYRIFANVARDLGLTSGFFWRSRDAVHVQLPEATAPRMTMAEIAEHMERRYGRR